MEKHTFLFQSTPITQTQSKPALCGVVGSGNLEILIKPNSQSSECLIELTTSARGFKTIWQAVLESFTQQHALGGTQIVIHDMGATPAVVHLRLQQTRYQYLGVK